MKHKFEGDQLVAVRITKKNLHAICNELEIGKSARKHILLTQYVPPHTHVYLVADKSVSPPRWRSVVKDVFDFYFEFVEPKQQDTLVKVKAKH